MPALNEEKLQEIGTGKSGETKEILDILVPN
jgi:hypothetical protein